LDDIFEVWVKEAKSRGVERRSASQG
jgi:hypothetical protein